MKLLRSGKVECNAGARSQCITDNFFHMRAFVAAQWLTRRAAAVVRSDHHTLHQLDVLNILHRGLEIEKRLEPAIEAARLVKIAGVRVTPDRQGLPRESCGQASDPPPCAHDEAFERQILHTAE